MLNDSTLRHELHLAVAAAESAGDPELGALMDRTDLQCAIQQLLRTLRRLETACEPPSDPSRARPIS